MGERSPARQGCENKGRLRRFAAVALAFLTIAVSLAFNLRGTDWATLAPDENRIAGWARSLDSGDRIFIVNRVYPEGYFALLKAIRRVDRCLDRIESRTASWKRQRDENAEAPVAPGTRFNIRRMRHINAWLGAFASLFIFLALREITGSAAISALGAVTFAACPILVEHAHYAETDMMMVFMETAALWLLTTSGARSGRRGGLWLFLAASFVIGGGIASKFTLAPMLLMIPVGAVAASRGKAARMALLSLAGLALALAGFVAMTPKLWHAPSLFFAQWSKNTALSYGEMEGILGEAATLPHAAFALKLRTATAIAAHCGALVWVAVVVALPLHFMRRFRRTAWPMAASGLLFMVAMPLFFPWIRSQELLPLLPFMVSSMALPLAAALECLRERDGAGPRWPVGLAAVAAAAMALAIFANTFQRGARTADAFAAVETRYAASNWIGRSAPSGRTFIVEHYAVAGTRPRFARDKSNRIESASKIERIPPSQWDEIDCDYFIRAENFIGRRNRDPFTGRLFPSRQGNLDYALSQAMPISRWCIRDGIDTTFTQSDIVLYANHVTNAVAAGEGAFTFPPAFIEGRWLGNRDVRVPLQSGILGPLKAAQVVNPRTTVEFQPLEDAGNWYAVVANYGRQPTTIAWTRGFTPMRAEVPGGGAVLFRSKKTLQGRFGAVPRAAVRMIGDDHAGICTAFFTRSLVAATALMAKFQGSECGRAENALGGIPPGVLRDFARINLGGCVFRTPDVPTLAKFRKGYAYAQLPFSVCSGNARLSVCLKPSRFNAMAQESGAKELARLVHLLGAKAAGVSFRGPDRDQNLWLDIEIAPGKPYAPLFLGLKTEEGGPKTYEALALGIEWDPVAALPRPDDGERGKEIK